MNGLVSGLKNKKTTTLGIISLVAIGAKIAEAVVNGDLGSLDWGVIIPAVSGSLAAIFAKDATTGSQPS